MFKLIQSHIFCINLPKRKDRYYHMIDEFERHDVSNYEFWNGLEPKDNPIPELSKKNKEYNAKGIYCCALSHIRLIESSSDYQYRIILEDDITLCDDFNSRLSYIEKLPYFDLFYIGGHFDDFNKETISTEIPNIFRIKFMAGTYGYIINYESPVVDYILRNWNYDWGWDEFLTVNVIPNFKCYAFIPFLVSHNDGYSDVAMHNVKYNCNQYYQKEKL